ncbi:MAG: hypothetical protein V4773_01340 [Verrucomicrobiota bacterium]
MIVLRQAELFQFPLKLRMPFRYGIATLTELPHAIVRLTFEIDGQLQTGVAADNLPPKWFTKDATRATTEEIAELFNVIRAAIAHAREIHAPTAFAFWQETYARQMSWARERRLPSLLANFGTSMVERALIDAACRARRINFATALRDNALGFDLGKLHAGLAGSAPRDWLPAHPASEVFARHTIGLSDSLDGTDLAPADRVQDGLPQTLIECIRAYGLRHFKIKINGETARDRARLEGMAAIFARECGEDYAFSLDGNESFREVGAFADTVRELMGAPSLAALWPHLLFIEQPWHRDVALSPAIGDLSRAWPDRPPIVIDESDAELDSTARALALGYAGTTHKNCKGVFKSVANACLLAQRRKQGLPAVLSGEDLTNVGPIALTQDMAAAAAIGVTTIERNGHHYFAGLSQFPPALQAHALAHHGDLFVHTPQGWPRVDVHVGRVNLGTTNLAPFGIAGEVDLSELAAEAI